MTSVYFQATQKGYVRHNDPGKLPVDHSKQLPVYRVVSEFMNLESTEDSVPSQEECVEQEKSMLGHQTSARFLDPLKSMKRSMAQPISQARHQITVSKELSENGQPAEYRTTKTLSQKDTEVTKGVTVGMSKKVGTILSGFHSVRDSAQFKSLSLELQREKEKRLLLEKEYEALKMNIESQSHEQLSDSEDYPHQKLDPVTQRHSVLKTNRVKQLRSSEQRSVRRTKTLRKGPVRLQKMSMPDEQDELSQNPEESMHELTREDLERFVQKRCNRRRISDSILRLQGRLDGIEAYCLRDEARAYRQQSVSGCSSACLSRHPSPQTLPVSCSKSKEDSPSETVQAFGKQNLHYLFTIVVLFLTVALVSQRNS